MFGFLPTGRVKWHFIRSHLTRVILTNWFPMLITLEDEIPRVCLKFRSSSRCLRAYFINPNPDLYIYSFRVLSERWKEGGGHVFRQGMCSSAGWCWGGPTSSWGILLTPRLSSSHPENVEVYGYCLVQRMSWLVVQRVLKATAWEYSAFGSRPRVIWRT